MCIMIQPKADFFFCYLQVKHSRTKFASSYAKDFQNLIDLYSGKRKTTGKKLADISGESEKQTDFDNCDAENIYKTDNDDDEEEAENSLAKKNSSRGKEMSEEYLEDETDIFQSVDDWDGMLLFIFVLETESDLKQLIKIT